MTHEIIYHETENYLEGKNLGLINRDLLRKYADDMAIYCDQRHCYRILSDFSEANFSFSTIEIFNLPTKHNEYLDSLGQNIHRLKRAILINSSQSELGKFFEDVAVNRGQNVSIFTDKATALGWLLGDPDQQTTTNR